MRNSILFFLNELRRSCQKHVSMKTSLSSIVGSLNEKQQMLFCFLSEWKQSSTDRTTQPKRNVSPQRLNHSIWMSKREENSFLLRYQFAPWPDPTVRPSSSISSKENPTDFIGLSIDSRTSVELFSSKEKVHHEIRIPIYSRCSTPTSSRQINPTPETDFSSDDQIQLVSTRKSIQLKSPFLQIPDENRRTKVKSNDFPRQTFEQRQTTNLRKKRKQKAQTSFELYPEIDDWFEIRRSLVELKHRLIDERDNVESALPPVSRTDLVDDNKVRPKMSKIEIGLTIKLRFGHRTSSPNLFSRFSPESDEFVFVSFSFEPNPLEFDQKQSRANEAEDRTEQNLHGPSSGQIETSSSRGNRIADFTARDQQNSTKNVDRTVDQRTESSELRRERNAR